MPFIVVYDANALVGNTLRDLLIRIGQSGLVQARWTERILDEAVAAVQKSRRVGLVTWKWAWSCGNAVLAQCRACH
ncbi:MAG: hypothetical protein ACYCO9_06350 [Streptosporangiaceae bacterium]